MARVRTDVAVRFENVLRPEKFASLGPLIGILGAERGLIATGRVISGNMRKIVKAETTKRTGNLRKPRAIQSRGSAEAKYIPSARINAPWYFHFLEGGVRIVRRVGKPRIEGGKRKYTLKDTGKRTKALRIYARAEAQNVARQEIEFLRAMQTLLQKAHVDSILNTSKTRKQVENKVKRLLRAEEKAARRQRARR